jgi:hypothetical protein
MTSISREQHDISINATACYQQPLLRYGFCVSYFSAFGHLQLVRDYVVPVLKDDTGFTQV